LENRGSKYITTVHPMATGVDLKHDSWRCKTGAAEQAIRRCEHALKVNSGVGLMIDGRKVSLASRIHAVARSPLGTRNSEIRHWALESFNPVTNVYIFARGEWFHLRMTWYDAEKMVSHPCSHLSFTYGGERLKKRESIIVCEYELSTGVQQTGEQANATVGDD
jgi:hypothetical protein